MRTVCLTPLRGYIAKFPASDQTLVTPTKNTSQRYYEALETPDTEAIHQLVNDISPSVHQTPGASLVLVITYIVYRVNTCSLTITPQYNNVKLSFV